MKITFDTQNKEEVAEVLAYLVGSDRKPTHNQTETADKPKKKTNPTPSIPKEEKVVEAPVEEKPKSSITLEVLKDSAKKAVVKTDRNKVKETISKYAPKLAEVKESDYGKLYKDLQALGK